LSKEMSGKGDVGWAVTRGSQIARRRAQPNEDDKKETTIRTIPLRSVAKSPKILE
jgi:hypothetical protein